MRCGRGAVHCIAALACLMTAACTAVVLTSNEPVAPSHAHARKAHRIAQIDFGRDARFALCSESACPRATPKTLLPAIPKNAPAAAQPLAMQSPPPAERLPAIHEEAPPASPPNPEPRKERVTVHFVSGAATLTGEGRSALRRAIPLARSSDRIVINGRTDSTGPDAVNQQLAFARALAVRDYIRTQVPDLPHAIAINARGNCCFVADNSTAEGRQKNRRVEVVFNLKV